MNWFRLYSEARNDAKLRTLTDSEHRVWFNLLCYAAEQKSHRGRITDFDIDLLAIEVSGGDTDLLIETLQKLSRLRIIRATQGSEILFLKFESRQYDKPSDTPANVNERVRAYRNRQKEGESEPNTPDQVTPINALRRDVTRCNAHTQKILRTEQSIIPKGPATIDPLPNERISSEKNKNGRAKEAEQTEPEPATPTFLEENQEHGEELGQELGKAEEADQPYLPQPDPLFQDTSAQDDLSAEGSPLPPADLMASLRRVSAEEWSRPEPPSHKSESQKAEVPMVGVGAAVSQVFVQSRAAADSLARFQAGQRRATA